MNSLAVKQEKIAFKLEVFNNIQNFLPLALENEYKRHIPKSNRLAVAGKATTSTRPLLCLACLNIEFKIIILTTRGHGKLGLSR